jgi:hypothetical protein
MTAPSQPTGPRINVPEGMQPAYTNLARISHSPADIVIDFAHILPGETTANIRSRVVMTPLSAKLLLRALHENIARYEAAFGEIVVPTTTPWLKACSSHLPSTSRQRVIFVPPCVYR